MVVRAWAPQASSVSTSELGSASSFAVSAVQAAVRWAVTAPASSTARGLPGSPTMSAPVRCGRGVSPAGAAEASTQAWPFTPPALAGAATRKPPVSPRPPAARVDAARSMSSDQGGMSAATSSAESCRMDAVIGRGGFGAAGAGDAGRSGPGALHGGADGVEVVDPTLPGAGAE